MVGPGTQYHPPDKTVVEDTDEAEEEPDEEIEEEAEEEEAA